MPSSDSARLKGVTAGCGGPASGCMSLPSGPQRSMQPKRPTARPRLADGWRSMSRAVHSIITRCEGWGRGS
eukprot:2222899-Prymnesium_polylepis.1